MKANFARLKSNWILLIVSMFFSTGGQTWAQSSTLEFEKATLVSKFLKHVSWPEEDRQSAFIVGVYNDAEKYEYFSDFFAYKGIKGKDIIVRLVKDVDEAKAVNILYISSLSNKRNLSILVNKISGSHVLIITEGTKLNSDMMVNIKYNEQRSNMIFEVNYPNIIDEKLTMPELSYFMDEKNNQNLLSASPTFLLETQKKQKLIEQQALEAKVIKQEALLDLLNHRLKLSEESSEKYNFVLEKHSERLKIAQQTIAKKNSEIKTKNEELQSLEKQLQDQKSQLEMNKQDLHVADEGKIEEQEKIIIDLTANLEKQKRMANNTAIKLTGMTQDNKNLSIYKILFYIFLIMLVIALIITYMMWNKVKNASTQNTQLLKNDDNLLLSVRENQLIKSENIAALGYIASDITYAISLSLDNLKDQLTSADDIKKAEILKPVVTLLEHFNLIAADQDETHIQNFDVIAYAQKMMMLYDFEFDQSDIDYHYSGEKELMIKSVPSYIALALLNLINNSLKHGFDNNGKGKIALKIEKGAKGGAKITYIDDGKGMNKSTLEQVFKPFFTTRSDRGYVGVGMSTTYDLIKNKLAGDIKIKSQEGKGTSVIITLP
ncbi:YfiR/HmsC family protein [Pseudocolwellia sp. AS88]|uniref:YfiR/HmsC family protein n=1 Tax=Pseudocolwellia sp. AS88 TaxID=3063958 RepID=UPI0026EA6100|nr:YfiR/HmsC family protein [Pseudocolwellia sp. AS88]MDO7084134.1 YfiR/HmsC family protein [Pseudocolwellia sp. AS88]